jgi:hypothetical protein
MFRKEYLKTRIGIPKFHFSRQFLPIDSVCGVGGGEVHSVSFLSVNYVYYFNRSLSGWNLCTDFGVLKTECCKVIPGRALARAVSCRLHTAETRSAIPGQFIWDLRWSKWHWSSFLRVLRFPLPAIIPPDCPFLSSIIPKWYNVSFHVLRTNRLIPTYD